MELIRISDSKLKITLSVADMEKYALCSDSMDYDNTETRRAFWEILDEAKQKTGFDAAKERVFVQVYPSRGGGCEMYVTKVGTLFEKEGVGEKPPPRRRPRVGIYRFLSLDGLLSACAVLHAQGYSEESAAYAERDAGRYYLILREHLCAPVGSDGTRLSEYGFLEEYGERLSGCVTFAYIKEHAVPLELKDAVTRLSALA